MKKLSILLLSTVLLVGACSSTSLFSGVVTVTSVVDSAMKTWAQLSVSHQTTPDIDSKVIAAHDKYRQAASVAQTMLISYKANGQTNNMVAILAIAKDGAEPVIDLVTSLMQPSDATVLKLQLTKASAL